MIGATGVVAGGDNGNLAVEANLDLFETELLVGQALAIAVQPCGSGEDEPEWADTTEVVGEEGRQRLGVSGALGGGPLREECVDVL